MYCAAICKSQMHLKGLSSYSCSFLLQMLFCFQHNSSFLWKSTSLNICQNILIKYFLYQCKSIKQKSPIVLDSTQKRMSHNNMLLKNTSCLAASSLPSSWFSPVYLRFALKQKTAHTQFWREKYLHSIEEKLAWPKRSLIPSSLNFTSSGRPFLLSSSCSSPSTWQKHHKNCKNALVSQFCLYLRSQTRIAKNQSLSSSSKVAPTTAEGQ